MQVFSDEALTPGTARLILLQIKDHRLRLILSLMKDTLARPSELLSLRLPHINLTHDPPYLTIPSYAAKNDIEREVFFTQETKEILIAWLQNNNITGQKQHIFLEGNPDPIGDEIGFQKEVVKVMSRRELNREVEEEATTTTSTASRNTVSPRSPTHSET